MTIRFYKNSAENPNNLLSVNVLSGVTSGLYYSSFSHMSLQLMPITPNNSTAVLITL